MPRLEAILERITYHSEQDGYTVARVQPRDKDYLVTIVGKLLGVQVGESLELEGRWVDHAGPGGADLQAVRRAVAQRGAIDALPIGRRCVWDRLPDRGPDRPGAGHPARLAAADRRGAALHSQPGLGGRPLLPAVGRADR